MKFQTNIMIKCNCPDCLLEVPIVIEVSPPRPWMNVRFIHATYALHNHPVDFGNKRNATCETSDAPIRGVCSVCMMEIGVFGDTATDHITGISNELCPGSGQSIYDFTAELALMEMMK